jgi:hypothetical protein
MDARTVQALLDQGGIGILAACAIVAIVAMWKSASASNERFIESLEERDRAHSLSQREISQALNTIATSSAVATTEMRGRLQGIERVAQQGAQAAQSAAESAASARDRAAAGEAASRRAAEGVEALLRRERGGV